MSRYNNKKKKYFLNKTRRERLKSVLRIKHELKKNEEEYSERFFSDVLFNSLENKKDIHFLDLFFLSKKDPSIFWNVELFTVYEILKDNLNDDEIENPYDIKEEFYIHKDFRYGIGLTIIVNEKNLDTETIHKIIDKFYAMGEKSWKSEKPVDKEELVAFLKNN